MGNVQFWHNKVLFTEAGRVAMDPACCCGGSDTAYALTPCTPPDEPCVTCNRPQPDATVAVGGSCNAACKGASGTYTFDRWVSHGQDHCQWIWVKGDWTLIITLEAGNWQAGVGGTPGHYGTHFGGWLVGSIDVHCDCLSGELVGDASCLGFECGGCTAAVTLGGVAQGDCDDRCPGGAPIFTRDDLSAYIGKVIEIAEDPDICYVVSVYGGTPDTVVEVTPTVVYDNCQDCCQDTGGSPA
jgi:hypothetical protein